MTQGAKLLKKGVGIQGAFKELDPANIYVNNRKKYFCTLFKTKRFWLEIHFNMATTSNPAVLGTDLSVPLCSFKIISQ